VNLKYIYTYILYYYHFPDIRTFIIITFPYPTYTYMYDFISFEYCNSYSLTVRVPYNNKFSISVGPSFASSYVFSSCASPSTLGLTCNINRPKSFVHHIIICIFPNRSLDSFPLIETSIIILIENLLLPGYYIYTTSLPASRYTILYSYTYTYMYAIYSCSHLYIMIFHV